MPSTPLGGNKIKLLGKKIKRERREEGKGSGKKGNGRRREREEGREKGSEREENRKRRERGERTQVEKWEVGEGNRVSGNFIQPLN